MAIWTRREAFSSSSPKIPWSFKTLRTVYMIYQKKSIFRKIIKQTVRKSLIINPGASACYNFSTKPFRLIFPQLPNFIFFHTCCKFMKLLTLFDYKTFISKFQMRHEWVMTTVKSWEHLKINFRPSDSIFDKYFSWKIYQPRSESVILNLVAILFVINYFGGVAFLQQSDARTGQTCLTPRG